MKTEKWLSIRSHLVVLFAFCLMISCEQFTQMEEPITEVFMDQTGVALEVEDDLTNARLAINTDCRSDCIAKGSGSYYFKKDSQSNSSGINTKRVSYSAYNTEDNFVVKVKSEITSGPSKATSNILIQINGKSKEFKAVPSGYTATFSVPLEKGWKGCDEITFSILQKGLGTPISFSEVYQLISVCKSDNGLILWNKLGSIEEVTNSAYGPNLFPGSGMEFQLGKYGKGIHIPQYAGKRAVHSPYSPRNIIPLWSFSIEFWFKRTHDKEWDGYQFFDNAYADDLKGRVRFGGRSGYVGMWDIESLISDNYGNTVAYYIFNLDDYTNWLNFLPIGEWHHLAISHNAFWPVQQRTKIFKDGVELVGLYAEDDTGEMSHVGQYGINGILIGNIIAWDKWGAGGVIDNIKIWDYPKTDFSDRFVEGH